MSGSKQKDDIQVIVIDQFSKLDNTSNNKVLSNPPPPKRKFFQHIKSHIKGLYDQNLYTDDQFIIQQQKNNKRIQKKRLKDIYKIGQPLFELNTQNISNSQVSIHKPSYLHQIQLLPLWHYKSLIQPGQINPRGFYEVVIWKEGRLVKEIIDDIIEYDQQLMKPVLNNCLKNQPWVHIIIKVWAKINGGYNRLYQCQPFLFVKTFSYPDWRTINPGFEDIEILSHKFTKVQKKNYYAICQTKNFKQVGQYGFLPNCAGYQIIGYQEDYGNTYVKIRSYVKSKWNKQLGYKQSSLPQQQPQQPNEFIMPFKQFLNCFHLVYITYNKFREQKDIYYSKYSLNIDARESKAKMICFSIKNQTWVDLNTYFPSSRSFDISGRYILINQKSQLSNNVVPYCKILIGLQTQNTNPQASLVESLVDYILNVEDDDFLNAKNPVEFEWVMNDYFMGYDNQVTYLLHLKPGKYHIRYKLQQMKSEYRCIINAVSSEPIIFSDPKMSKNEQSQYMKQVLASKARIEKRNITYLNPVTKKGSWIIINEDFDTVGYGSIIFHSVRNSQSKIVLQVDPKIMKEYGYKIKGKKDQMKYSIVAEEGTGQVLIIKRDLKYNKERVWPPPGILVFKFPSK